MCVLFVFWVCLFSFVTYVYVCVLCVLAFPCVGCVVVVFCLYVSGSLGVVCVESVSDSLCVCVCMFGRVFGCVVFVCA